MDTFLEKKPLDRLDTDYSWHPYTQMKDYLAQGPLHIVRAEGCWLYDAQGRGYLDCHASNWSSVHGHNDPDLNQAIIDQVAQLSHSSYKDLSHPKASDLCGLLANISPEGLTRSFFTDNGSCGMETAFKLSLQYWKMTGFPKKRKGVCMENSYHGDTFGAMSVSRSPFHAQFGKTAIESYAFPAPHCHEYGGVVYQQSMDESLKDLEGLLQAHHDEIAFLILEPSIQGPGQMRFQPPGFLKAVAHLCREFRVHLILDEVFVGFYRTGEMFFACQKEGVSPDFMCLGKGLTGGYLPLSVTMATEEIYNAYYDDYARGKTFFHGHTFAANPLACAVTVRNIQKLNARIASGEFTKNQKNFERITVNAFQDHPYIEGIRQRGFVFAMDLEVVEGKEHLFAPEKRLGHLITLLAREKGLMLRAFGNCIFFLPSFSMTEAEVTLMCAKTSESICEFMKHYLN